MVAVAVIAVAACSDDGLSRADSAVTLGSGPSGTTSGTGDALDGTGDSQPTTGDPTAGSAGSGIAFDLGASPDAGAGGECDPPDVLIVLDRSQSMHRLPDGGTPPDNAAGHMLSRWWLALDALDAFAVTFEGGLRIGLTLFPRDPGAGCVDLATRIGGTSASNDGCMGMATEALLAPALGAAAAVDAALDPPTTLLCNETPIDKAVAETTPVLLAAAVPDREQFVILVSDGGESCDGMPTTRVQELVAATGAKVYVVAFGNSFMTNDHGTLNDMACAGQTADGFPVPCVDDGAGNYTAADPNGATLYIAAEDGMALVDAFNDIATELCCGDACPPG